MSLASVSSKKLTAELQTISDFTAMQLTLPLEKKREIYSELEKIFAECAYTNQVASLPASEEQFHSFAAWDAPDLVSIAKELGLGRQTAHRLIANILKVCRICHAGRAELPICEIHIKEEGGEDIPLFWGWIKQKYVHSSEKLSQRLKEGKIVLNEGEMDPFVLLAIPRLQEVADNLKKGRDGIDLPIQMLAATAFFAIEWDILPMLQDLALILKVWKNAPAKEREEEFLHATESFNELYETGLLEEVLGNINDYGKELPDQASFPSLSAAIEEDATKEWFHASHPIESIVQFTARCCTLSPAEQNRFFNATRKFFNDKLNKRAYNSGNGIYTIDAPIGLKDRFEKYYLHFMNRAMNLAAPERQRFIYAFDRITKYSSQKEAHESRMRQLTALLLKGEGHSDTKFRSPPRAVLSISDDEWGDFSFMDSDCAPTNLARAQNNK